MEGQERERGEEEKWYNSVSIKTYLICLRLYAGVIKMDFWDLSTVTHPPHFRCWVPYSQGDGIALGLERLWLTLVPW